MTQKESKMTIERSVPDGRRNMAETPSLRRAERFEALIDYLGFPPPPVLDGEQSGGPEHVAR